MEEGSGEVFRPRVVKPQESKRERQHTLRVSGNDFEVCVGGEICGAGRDGCSGAGGGTICSKGAADLFQSKAYVHRPQPPRPGGEGCLEHLHQGMAILLSYLVICCNLVKFSPWLLSLSPGGAAAQSGDGREGRSVGQQNDYDYVELKYALRVIQQKCGHYRRQIELELSQENKATEGADEFQIQYIRNVSKKTILHGRMEKQLQEINAFKKRCEALEEAARKKPGILSRLKSPLFGAAVGKFLDFVLGGGGGMSFRR